MSIVQIGPLGGDDECTFRLPSLVQVACHGQIDSRDMLMPCHAIPCDLHLRLLPMFGH